MEGRAHNPGIGNLLGGDASMSCIRYAVWDGCLNQIKLGE